MEDLKENGAATLVAEDNATAPKGILSDKVASPKGYKQTKVGMIPEEWDIPRIDTVLQRVRKKVDVQKNELYQEIGIRSHAKGIFHKDKISGEALGNKSVFWVEENCFVLNIVFAWEQAVAKTTVSEKGMIASHRFPMYKSKNDKVDIDYILYFFKSKRGKHLLGLASPGGAGRNKTLGQKDFAELRIPLPPLKEQQKIAQLLTTWDKAIEKLEALITAKEQLKKGLMQKLLSGEVRFGAATLVAEDNATEVASPEWEEVKLGDVAEIIMGQSPSSSSYNENQKGVPLIQGNADCKNRKTSPRIYTTEITKVCKIGDIIMTVRAPVGAISKAYHDACIGRGVCAIRTKDDNEFLYYYLLMYEEKWEKYSQGSTFTAVNSSDIKSLKIKLPPLEEQQKIAQLLTTADKEIELLKEELEALKEQKRGLMQKLLTGEVRVKV